MGQYKRVEITKEKKPYIEIDANTIEKCGYTEIIIPKQPLEKLYQQTKAEIYKLTIENKEKYEYYWEYNQKRRENKIVFKELKPGNYRIRIEPYTVEDFIKEYNQKIREKQEIKLEIRNNTLITYIQTREAIKTQNWKYQKQHGGAVIIEAKYPGETRKTITIHYQLKRGKANIKILEERKTRRPVPEHVTKISSTKHGVEIQYKHGKVIKTTFIPNTSLIELMKYKIPKEAITFTLKREFGNSREYFIKFANEDAYYTFKRQMIVSYDLLKKQRSVGVSMREKMAINIASVYLLQYERPNQLIIEAYKKSYFGDILSKLRVKPDIITVSHDNRMSIYEVKFLSNKKLLSLKRKDAIAEVEKQAYAIKSAENMFGLPLSHYGIIIVTLNFKRRAMYLYFERKRLTNWRY